MQIRINSVDDIGVAIRATRRDADVRLDDLAAVTSLSKQFVNDVELGKPGVGIGKVLELLSELGIEMTLDVPQSVADALPMAREQIDRTKQRRIVNLQGKASLKISASGTLSAAPPDTKDKP